MRNTILLLLLWFILYGCTNNISEQNWLSNNNREQKEVLDLSGIISNAYSGKRVYSTGVDFYSSDDYPAINLFLEQNPWTHLIGSVPYFNEKWEIRWEEYFLSCKWDIYCASFYTVITYSPISWWGEKRFVKTMRIRKDASPTIRLARLLWKTDNQYFHGQYAYNLSDYRVLSLDPKDTDITNTGALFQRLSLFSDSYSRELTRLVHDRYYVSGGLTNVWGIPVNSWSGNIILTGILLRNPDYENIPTRLSARLKNPELSSFDKWNIEICTDAFERQLYSSGTNTPRGTIEYVCGQEWWSNNNGVAMYIQFARLYGTLTFDSILSRTSWVIWSEPPYKNPCTSLECPEDNEFVYGL